jgi:hypothetical protein
MNLLCALLKGLIEDLFLVKVITSKEGKVHFRRYRLLATPWFNIYIHQILKSDEEAHFHDHPWNFWSFILKGGYKEISSYAIDKWREIHTNYYLRHSLVHHKRNDAHKLTLMSSCVWTLVLTYGEWKTWGYQTEAGWIDFKSYRGLKDEGKFRQ